MTILVTAQTQLIVGEAMVIKSLAPDGILAAAFEDDGNTGYFYALDESAEGNPVRDAVHIYNDEDISEAHNFSFVFFLPFCIFIVSLFACFVNPSPRVLGRSYSGFLFMR